MPITIAELPLPDPRASLKQQETIFGDLCRDYSVPSDKKDVLKQGMLRLSGQLLAEEAKKKLLPGLQDGAEAIRDWVESLEDADKARTRLIRSLTTGYAGATDVFHGERNEGHEQRRLELIAALQDDTRRDDERRRQILKAAESYLKIPGGRLRLFTMQFGEPKRNFVDGCYDLYVKVQTEEPTATEDGSFEIFCSLIYEFATGTSASLAHYVRKVVTTRREASAGDNQS